MKRNATSIISITSLAISLIALIYLSLKNNNDEVFTKLFFGTLGGIFGGILCFSLIKAFNRHPKSTVFILHSLIDKHLAMELSKTLESKRIKVIDEDDIIHIGDNIIVSSKNAIIDSDYIIYILSNNSKNDRTIRMLINESKSLSKRIIPFMIDKIENLPNSMSDYKIIDSTHDFKKATDDLANTLSTV